MCDCVSDASKASKTHVCGGWWGVCRWWVGCMGHTATHAVVFAQLYTADKVCHGLHSFVVQVSLRSTVHMRGPSTHADVPLD